jgi:hypothetical protein
MLYFNIYNLIRILSTICFLATAYKYWSGGFIGNLFILAPYVIVYLLANKNAYNTKLRLFCRTVAGILVSVLAVAIFIGVEPDAQAAIVIGFGIVIQYGVIFVSEAIIGLATYGEK